MGRLGFTKRGVRATLRRHGTRTRVPSLPPEPWLQGAYPNQLANVHIRKVTPVPSGFPGGSPFPPAGSGSAGDWGALFLAAITPTLIGYMVRRARTCAAFAPGSESDRHTCDDAR